MRRKSSPRTGSQARQWAHACRSWGPNSPSSCAACRFGLQTHCHLHCVLSYSKTPSLCTACASCGARKGAMASLCVIKVKSPCIYMLAQHERPGRSKGWHASSWSCSCVRIGLLWTEMIRQALLSGIPHGLMHPKQANFDHPLNSACLIILCHSTSAEAQ